MKISVITPTCGRHAAIPFIEKYMRAQTVQPDEWVVADGGVEPAPLTMGQTHIHYPCEPGARNLARNMLHALEAVTGDVVVMFEDDDIYLPNHIEESVKVLQRQNAAGCSSLRYFNLEHRCWIEMRNKGSALCQTSFRREALNLMRNMANECLITNSYCLDQKFWGVGQWTSNLPQTVIGLKGLPGVAGLGIGHRPDFKKRGWVSDPSLSKLKEWVGEDIVRPYTELPQKG